MSSASIPENPQERRLLSEQINRSLENPHLKNEFNQQVGPSLPQWTPVQRPNFEKLVGQYIHIVPLDVDAHLDDLWEVFSKVSDAYYTYLFVGPFRTKDEMRVALTELKAGPHYYMTIFDNVTGKAAGYVNLMNIHLVNGTIEIGSVCFGPSLQGNRKGTEVVWTLMKYCFASGYRRFEWKCDANNLPSRKAALRFGFTFEGMFRKHFIYRGRSRDTTWFAITDDEFNEIMVPSYEEYLNENNFDATGVQIKSLPECRQALREAFDAKWIQQKDAVEAANSP